jgi:hypothetical protein
MHAQPPQAPLISPAVAKLEQLLAALPTCASDEGTIDVVEAVSPPWQGGPRRIRGHLWRGHDCPAVTCDRACCTRCRGLWRLGLYGEVQPYPLLLHPADEQWQRLAWEASDCELEQLYARAAVISIVASGTVRLANQCTSLDRHAGSLFGGDSEVVYTSLCVLRAPSSAARGQPR